MYVAHRDGLAKIPSCCHREVKERICLNLWKKVIVVEKGSVTYSIPKTNKKRWALSRLVEFSIGKL
jgi:hypothetical protein